MKIADYGKAITSYIESPTKAEKDKLKHQAGLLEEYLGNQLDYQKAVDEGFQGTEEEYRQYKSTSEEDRTFLADGTPPPKKPKQLSDLFERINRTVLAIRSNTIKPEFILPDLEELTQEYIKDGLISGEDARKFAIERKDYWEKWITENPKGTTPVFDFDNEGNAIEVDQEEIIKRINKAYGGRIRRAIGGGVIKGKDLGSREGFAAFVAAAPYLPAALNIARTGAMPLIRKGLEVAAGTGIGKRLSDTFLSKDEGDDKKEIIPSDDKNNLIQGDGPEEEPPKFDKIAEDFLIEQAVERLKTKEMDVTKRDDRTKLARDLDLAVTKSGMFEIREGDFLDKRIQTLKDKKVNFDGYYSVPEIANLLGTKSSSGIQSFIKDKEIPFVKKGLYKMVKLSDFLNTYQGTKERIDLAPPADINTLARSDFLSEIGGSFYQRFKDMRRPKFLPPEVKEIYEKYNLSEIEGGHPFPIEFFTKKFGKNNTLQKDRQFDWIYRNKDKLFSKNNLVFQSKEVNKLFRNSIKDLKKLYKELGPYVDKYEGKGAVTNQKDISKIEEINNDIIEIIAKSEFDAKKYIDESDNKVDLERFKTGGLHGALFNTDTGEVSLYTGVGEGAGFEAIGKEPTDVKLKLAGDYDDIINNIITDESDKKIFTDFISQKLLPKFQKGGPVYGKYAKQIAGLS